MRMQKKPNGYESNSEGYHDPTASAAVYHITAEEKEKQELDELVRTIKYVIRKSGFRLLNRLELENKRSGRVYR